LCDKGRWFDPSYFVRKETFVQSALHQFDALVADRAQKLWNVNLRHRSFPIQPQAGGFASRRVAALAINHA